MGEQQRVGNDDEWGVATNEEWPRIGGNIHGKTQAGTAMCKWEQE
jgi:hypothetical protein